MCKRTGNTDQIIPWKSKGLSDEILKRPTTSENNLDPALSYFANNARVKFYGKYLKQDEMTFTDRKIVNMYIFYEINLWNYVDSGDLMVASFFLGAVKLVENADTYKYWYSGYGFRFDTKGISLFFTCIFDKNATIFGVDMCSSVHVDNNKKRNFNSW